MDFDVSAFLNAIPQLLKDGAVVTIEITIFGLVGGFIIGTLAGVVRAYIPVSFSLKRGLVAGVVLPILPIITQLYILLIRGTPMMVQVMFIYFALPLMFHFRVDPLVAAMITLAINSGAYIAEIVRGALQSVPKGLFEAGQAMGLHFFKILSRIVGPIAFRRMIPALGNQCIISLKDTSLFIVVSVAELTRQGQEIIATTYQSAEIWSAVAIIYLCLTGLMALVLKILENRMRIA